MTIFLCGFMGCGKTTVGEILAKQLGLPLIDTDAYIVEQEGRSIPEIFAQEGEPYFRKVEAQAIRTLCTKNAVIACGGGAMLNPDSAAYARENGAVVLLNESFDTCYARIQGDTNRPIVQRSTKEELHQLFDQRAGIYRAHASHVVDGGVSPEQMAERVAAAVQCPNATQQKQGNTAQSLCVRCVVAARKRRPTGAYACRTAFFIVICPVILSNSVSDLHPFRHSISESYTYRWCRFFRPR